MKAVKVALIGNAHDHACMNTQAMLLHPESFELIGACGLIPGKDESVYRNISRYSIEELLNREDLEGVIIESGKENEVYDAQRFADRNIPVFLDKPGSSSVSAFDRLIDTLEEKQLPFGMGYMYRTNPSVQKALTMLKNGELGEIFSVEAQMSTRHPDEKRAWLGKYHGGAMYFLGCHLIDLVCQFQGFPKKVIPMSFSTGIGGIDSEDYGFAVLCYEKGLSFVKTCSSEVNGFGRRQLVICGSKGTVEIKPFECHAEEGFQVSPAVTTLLSDNPPTFDNASKPMETPIYHRYYPLLLQFAQQIRGEASLVKPYEYERKLFHTIAAACGVTEEIYRGRRE